MLLTGPADAAETPVAAIAATPLEGDASSKPKTGRAAYVAIVRGEATAQGLPPEVAEAVAHIESGYNPSAVGGVGEIGLMQIRPATAELMGHDGGTLALFDPATNARYAVKYLVQAWRLANGDLCRALMKYRAGHNAEWMSPLSASYCARARGYLATLGSPLADGAAPMPIMAGAGSDTESVRSRRKGYYLGWRPGPKTAADNARFWKAHEARIRTLTAQAEQRRASRIKAAARRLARL